MPDAVGGVADVDDGERVLADDLEAAGPSRIAQAGAYRSLDPVGSLARLLALQPQQKQGDGYSGIVGLECAGQARFEAAKIMVSELEIEMLA